MNNIGTSKKTIKTVETGAETAQYVWNTQTDTGAGAGLHITNIPEADFIADPESGGMNVLMQSNSQMFRDGLTVRAIYGVDETVLMTPNGAEAFKVSAAAGAVSKEIVTYYIGTEISANSSYTLTSEVLADVETGDTITATFHTKYGVSSYLKNELEFTKGTEETKTFLALYRQTTVAYNGSDSFVITTQSLSTEFYSIKFPESTPTPEISIRDLILSNGFNYVESHFLAWENDSPDADFPARRISLNGYDGMYDAVEIYYRAWNGDSSARVLYQKLEVGMKGNLIVAGWNANRTGGRLVTVDSNGVDFDSGHYDTSQNNNSWAIPIKIIAVKYI